MGVSRCRRCEASTGEIEGEGEGEGESEGEGEGESEGKGEGEGDVGDAGEGGAVHMHVHETHLDYKQVRKYAPTFAAIEHDPSLLECLRGVPGLEGLDRQHVRIQINSGHGGCYTMHTDEGEWGWLRMQVSRDSVRSAG